MKPRWLWLLLALSLAGNAVELGAYVKRSWTGIRQMLGSGWGRATSSASYTLRAIGDTRRAEFDSLEDRVHRLEILTAVLDPTHDATRIDSFQRERARLRREATRVVYLSGREIADVADPARRRWLTQRWCDMMDIKGGEKPKHFDTH